MPADSGETRETVILSAIAKCRPFKSSLPVVQPSSRIRTSRDFCNFAFSRLVLAQQQSVRYRFGIVILNSTTL